MTEFEVEFANIAEYGDWVVLSDGKPATVVRAQPFFTPDRGGGYYYDLMTKGGSEITLYHYSQQPEVLESGALFGSSVGKTEPLFTVLDQQEVVAK